MAHGSGANLPICRVALRDKVSRVEQLSASAIELSARPLGLTCLVDQLLAIGAFQHLCYDQGTCMTVRKVSRS
jgi:hypothetical protein